LNNEASIAVKGSIYSIESNAVLLYLFVNVCDLHVCCRDSIMFHHVIWAALRIQLCLIML